MTYNVFVGTLKLTQQPAIALLVISRPNAALLSLVSHICVDQVTNATVSRLFPKLDDVS